MRCFLECVFLFVRCFSLGGGASSTYMENYCSPAFETGTTSLDKNRDPTEDGEGEGELCPLRGQRDFLTDKIDKNAASELYLKYEPTLREAFSIVLQHFLEDEQEKGHATDVLSSSGKGDDKRWCAKMFCTALWTYAWKLYGDSMRCPSKQGSDFIRAQPVCTMRTMCFDVPFVTHELEKRKNQSNNSM